MLVEEPMMIDHLFEVIGQPHETFKSYVTSFKATLQAINNLNQHLTMIACKHGLLTVPWSLRDHFVITDLILDSVEICPDAKVLIFYHVQIKETRSLCSTAFS